MSDFILNDFAPTDGVFWYFALTDSVFEFVFLLLKFVLGFVLWDHCSLC